MAEIITRQFCQKHGVTWYVRDCLLCELEAEKAREAERMTKNFVMDAVADAPDPQATADLRQHRAPQPDPFFGEKGGRFLEALALAVIAWAILFFTYRILDAVAEAMLR